MKVLDILILYEGKHRELDSMCLLKYELDRRGYTTEIVCTNEMTRKYKNPQYRVQLVLGFVGNNMFTCNHNLGGYVLFQKAISIPWEQFLVKSDYERGKNLDYADAISDYIIQVAWGADYANYLNKYCGIKEKNIRILGHIGLDFCKQELVKYFPERKELAQKYKINENKKWILFISSLSICQFDEKKVKYFNELAGFDVSSHRNTQIETRKVILDWFEHLLPNMKDYIVIYRPHPTEAKEEDVMQLEKNFINFKIIAGESVKSWIMACELNYIWNSTSIVEAFCLNKNCQIIQPILIEKEFSYPFFEKADIIRTYDEFTDSLNKKSFAINDEDLYKVIGEVDEYIYLKICDLCEEVINDDVYEISKEVLNEYRKYHYEKERKKSGIQRIKEYIISCDFLLFLYMKCFRNKENYEFVIKDRASPTEINMRIDKIENCLKKFESRRSCL